MEKTVIQQAIEYINLQISDLQKTGEDDIDNYALEAHQGTLEYLQSLLPKEKEQLRDLYIEGYMMRGENVSEKFENYYKQTYGTE